MQHRTIAFIGAGNMSRSIISGMVSSGYPADKITASNPSTPKLDALSADFGINTTTDNLQALQQSEVIVLAVKPQLMEKVCEHLQQTDLSDKLFISIAAGIEQKRLLEMLGGNYKLVRTMPNTPSSLAKGMTGLYADKSISDTDRQYAGDLLKQVGEILWVEQESMINGVIAAAGSSPAYFFLFLQSMQEEAMRMGFDQDASRLLVQQAMLGAAEMVCHNPQLELSELRAQVTSKGGTTAQAIASFQDSDIAGVVSKAMQAAVNRAKQMSDLF
ncbi:pyrroline-5-carboxylate reductase [Neptunicella sp. SCSIO 80796]|uniref:pyrroline-5-carboxylate reductase n=1 Tax=Neptunicella plasticusilytica TaxID=3117012 RepID=UPI003A4DC283